MSRSILPSRLSSLSNTAIVTLAFILVTLVASLRAGLADEAAIAGPAKPRIGDKVGLMTFTDIRFLPRSLADLSSPKDPIAKRAFVLVFTNTTCPLVQKYLPRLDELDREYRDRGVQVVSVNVGLNDSILEIATQAVKYNAGFPFVRDIDGSCVKACGVERTPEVVLIDAEHRLRYRGRIDDQYRLGGTAQSPTRSELREAIDALLAGKEIAIVETPVDGCRITLPSTTTTAVTNATYTGGVATLIEKNCRECHQPGTSAPFSLITYEDVSAHAAMIAEVVAEQRMPPWYASPEFGHFDNCRTLSDQDRQTIVNWALAGAPRGTETPEATASAKDAAVSVNATKQVDDDPAAKPKWQMGEPDLVLELSTIYDVPAEGVVDYKYAMLPHVFWQDTWIQGAEILPSNPRVVHHCNMGMVSPLDPKKVQIITGYVPGGGPMELSNGVSAKIPGGTVLGLQIHLTTTGKPEKCQLRVGLRFAKERVRQELRLLQLYDNHFRIPPFAPHFEVTKSRTLDRDITAFGMFAHMHVRGKDITFRAFPPERDPEILLMIPNYNFDWQLPYYLPANSKKFPAGTRFECRAHFDNSTFNPYNPDPAATVRVGEQTVNEMMYGFLFYTVDGEQLDLAVNPKTGVAGGR